jgi:hypothetical protein
MTNSTLSNQTLTPLERQLIATLSDYSTTLERSTNALSDLELRSTTIIEKRQALLSDCMMALISSQIELATLLQQHVTGSTTPSHLSAKLTSRLTSLNEIKSRIKKGR